VTIDTGDPDNIHPPDKREVGDRLAFCALAEHYGSRSQTPDQRFPQWRRLPGAMRLHFDHADGGLMVKGDKRASFSLAGDDRKVYWADARLQGDDVIVSTASVPDPKAGALRLAGQSRGDAVQRRRASGCALPHG